MKLSVFLLDSDNMIIDKIQKRLQIENDIEVVGFNNNTTMGYSQIQNIKPDVIIFGYPSNFTAKQLSDAMKSVNPSMTLIGLVNQNDINSYNELNNEGIIVINKPIENSIDNLINITLKGIINKNKALFNNNPINSNPFENNSSINNNPFGNNNSINSNPFGNNNSINNDPFGNNNKSKEVAKELRNNNNMFDNNDNLNAFNQFHQTSSNRTIRQKVIAIHCPKGGVGKTSVSINVGTLLSTVKMGKNPLNILIVDMDWAKGNVCTNLDMVSSPNVTDWIREIEARKALTQDKNYDVNMNFTQAQIEKFLVTYEKTGLKVLAAPQNIEDYSLIENSDKIAEIIVKNLKNNCNFDIIILDCGNNYDDHTTKALFMSDYVYEVTTMDISTIGDIEKLKTTLKSAEFPMERIKIIFNKLPKVQDYSISSIEDFLGTKIVAVIPDDDKVRIQNNAGTPLVLSKTTNAFTENIKHIANDIMGCNMFNKKKSSNSQQNKKGFFARLLGK